MSEMIDFMLKTICPMSELCFKFQLVYYDFAQLELTIYRVFQKKVNPTLISHAACIC